MFPGKPGEKWSDLNSRRWVVQAHRVHWCAYRTPRAWSSSGPRWIRSLRREKTGLLGPGQHEQKGEDKFNWNLSPENNIFLKCWFWDANSRVYKTMPPSSSLPVQTMDEEAPGFEPDGSILMDSIGNYLVAFAQGSAQFFIGKFSPVKQSVSTVRTFWNNFCFKAISL